MASWQSSRPFQVRNIVHIRRTTKVLIRPSGAIALCGVLAAAVANAAAPPDPLARDIFKQLIEINTTDSVGSTTVAAQAMQKRFLDAGFAPKDAQVLVGPNPKRGNLVARLHGKGKGKPVLIIAHLDVVEAKREDWTVDPFVFTEKDGYFYGRGTQDMKNSDAVAVAALIHMKKEGFVPNRDIVINAPMVPSELVLECLRDRG